MTLPQFLGQVLAAAGEDRPNVLVLQPDQHRGTMMGCMGDKQAITPNLDRMAGEGILFRNCVSSSPVCCPFRASMQTGLYPHKHGVLSNDKYRLDPSHPTFAEMFEKAGYKTGYIGKWHLDGGLPKKEGGEGVTPKAVGGFVPPERRRGYQEWNGYEKSHEYFEVWTYNEEGKKIRVQGYDWEPTWFTDKALDFAKRHSEAKEPWLYYVAYGPPHVPEECLPKYLNMFPPEKFELPPDVKAAFTGQEEAMARKEFQMYYALVTAIDTEVGRLLEGLKQLGVDNNTIILYTSDHGDVLGSHVGGKAGKGKPAAKGKSSGEGESDAGYEGESKFRGKAKPYANAFRTPLIVHWPKKIKAGQVCDALVSGVDLPVTLLDLAGAPPIPGAQGVSVAPWCLTGNGPKREGIWIGLGSWRAVWDGRYVYSPAPFNILYDHDSDPCEVKNLLGDPASQAEQQRLHALLTRLAREVEDPLAPELDKMATGGGGQSAPAGTEKPAKPGKKKPASGKKAKA
ncbi:MAG: sulfatase-like hydrolase/transferase [Candidatus Sumerlaeota bacterium]|nr:sulfatase-like hydrolase/transferase [Candidatus Sumerlaeota bacterium]